MTFDKLKSMEVFVEVVNVGSFTRAGELLNLSQGMVSKHVTRLEQHLEVKLLTRSSRKLSLTSQGTVYYKDCLRIFADIAKTEDALSSARNTPSGKLRLDMPNSVGNHIILPIIKDFMKEYPQISFKLNYADSVSNTRDDDWDVAVCYDMEKDLYQNMIARRVGYLRGVICATPEYLERHGIPQTPKDLLQHSCINYMSPSTGGNFEWYFQHDGKLSSLMVPGAFTFSENGARINAALNGLGLVEATSLDVNNYIREGRLKMVLNDWVPQKSPLWMIFPEKKYQSARIRLFVDCVMAHSSADQIHDPLAGFSFSSVDA